MILDMSGSITTSLHKICISNQTRNLFLTVHPNLAWTDNILFARTFDSQEEIIKFVEISSIQEFLENDLEQYIWTDTKQPIY